MDENCELLQVEEQPNVAANLDRRPDDGPRGPAPAWEGYNLNILTAFFDG